MEKQTFYYKELSESTYSIPLPPDEPMTNIMVLDIETVPNPYMECFTAAFADQLKAPTAEDAPKNMSKPETIARWIEKEAEKRQEVYPQEFAKMALDVDYAQIDSIAWRMVDRRGGNFEIVLLTGGDVVEERNCLRQFWNFIRQHTTPRLCGYNILGFDLPILMRRSWVLGVPPVRYKARRYSDEQVIDVMQLLYGWGQYPLHKSNKYRSLKKVCEMFGIENPLPGLHGGLYAQMDDVTKSLYNLNDVRMTWELARRMEGVYWN